MELPTLTSWLELTTLELPLSPAVLRSPPTMAGPTLSGILTPWPTILPLLSFHPPLTSMTTLLHHACPWQETLPMKLNLSQLLDGESPQTVLEESPQSSGWSQIFHASLPRRAMTSMELLPSVLLLVVRLDSQLDSPGLSTTWTGSSLRLECNCILAIVHSKCKSQE